MTADLQSAVQRALSAWDTTTLKTNGDGMLAEAMEALRTEFDSAVMLNGLTEAETNETASVKGLTASPAEGDATLTEEQIDRFIPERIGVRNWGKPEQADLFNRGQVRDAIRTAIASQPNVQPKAAEVDAAPWSKTVESAALLLQRCTGLELQDCENLAGTILGMAANVQPKGTPMAWHWEHYSVEHGTLIDSGVALQRVEPTKHAYIHKESGGWIGTRVTPLYASVQAPAPAPADPDGERFRWLIDDRNWDETNDTPSVCTSEDVHWGDKARALIDRHMKKDWHASL